MREGYRNACGHCSSKSFLLMNFNDLMSLMKVLQPPTLRVTSHTATLRATPPMAFSDLLRLNLSPSSGRELNQRFVAGMGRTAGAVSVVTTDGTAGRFGQTVSAMMSVTADPPTLAIGLFRGAPVADAVRTNRCFAVNVLSTGDLAAAQSFSGQADIAARYKFGDGWTSLRTSSPVRLAAVAVFDCHAEQFLIAGSHLLILGRVVEAIAGEGEGLTYSHRSYGRHLPLGG